MPLIRIPRGRAASRPRLVSRAALAILLISSGSVAFAGTAGAGGAATTTPAASGAAAADSVPMPRPRPDDPWKPDRLLAPIALHRMLDAKGKQAPFLLHVGFGVLYRGGHIPASEYAGPGSKMDGVTAIRTALKDVPKERPVVLYCGCCPWGDCPNVRPAFRAVEKLGFKDVRVLYLPRSLQQDWIDKGYGVERAER